MNIADAQFCIRAKFNDIRALERIVHSVSFAQCLRLDPNNPRLERAIQDADLEYVREWMDSVLRNEIGDKTIRQLRALAAQLGIRNYTGVPKDDLLILIIQVRYNEIKSTEDNVSRMPLGTNGTQAIPGKS